MGSGRRLLVLGRNPQRAGPGPVIVASSQIQERGLDPPLLALTASGEPVGRQGLHQPDGRRHRRVRRDWLPGHRAGQKLRRRQHLDLHKRRGECHVHPARAAVLAGDRCQRGLPSAAVARLCSHHPASPFSLPRRLCCLAAPRSVMTCTLLLGGAGGWAHRPGLRLSSRWARRT